MSFFDKIKNMVNVPEDEDYGYDDGMDDSLDYGQRDEGPDTSYAVSYTHLVKNNGAFSKRSQSIENYTVR